MMKPMYLGKFACIALLFIITVVDAKDIYEKYAADADADFCNPNPCKNGAECLKYSKKCSCPSGYSGDYCETCKCENGFCRENEQGISVCTCPKEFGLYSATKCKECKCGKDSNCKFEGWLSSKTCLCKAGYEDKSGVCKGTCKENPCQNKGKCNVKGDGIACDCPKPFSGELCEKKDISDPCSQITCKNGGTCKADKGKAKCVCKDRFVGELCDKDVCSPNPCQNGGVCSATKGKVTCQCKDSFTGPNCTKDFCLPNPCQHGGACSATKGKVSCVCKDPYTGPNCTQSLCLPNPCQHDGACSATKGKVTCFCKDPYTGPNCTKSLCLPNPCQHDGACSATKGKVTCVCKDPYTGPNCTIMLSTVPDSTTKEETSTTEIATSSIAQTTRDTTLAVTDTTVTTNLKTTDTTSPQKSTVPMTTHPNETPMTATSTMSSTTVEAETDNITVSHTDSTLSSNPTTELVTLTSNFSESTTEVGGESTTLSSNFTTEVGGENTTLSSNFTTEVGGENTTLSLNFTTETTTSEGKETTQPVSTTTSNENDTTTQIGESCKDNPCKNGGTCVVSEGVQKCLCSYPYGGETCGESHWCTEGLGKTLCEANASKCVFDFNTRIGRCSCAEGEFYNYDKRECQDIDKCSLTPEKCKGANEVCKMNECVCIENFIRNEKNECISNFCESSRNVCGYNTTCEENPSDPENVKCVCRENETWNGEVCVEVNKCDVLHLLGCEQICNSTTESCDCHDGYSLQNDTKSCNLTADPVVKCSKNCTPGICYSDGGIESCICPPTHVYINGSCKDLCTAKRVRSGLCPGDACEPHPTLGFRCKCVGQLTYDKNNVTCRRKFMCSEGDGLKVCSKKSAKCVEDFNSTAGFRCECAQSDEMDTDGTCKSKCDLKKNQEKCFAKGAVCEMEGSEAICTCPQLITFSNSGWCDELAASYTGSIPFAKNKYAIKTLYAPGKASPGPDYNKMRQDLRNSMRLIYGINYKFADILDCSNSTASLNCTVEIKFASDPRDQVKLIGDPGTCISNGPDTCFIPPELELRKKDLTPDLLTQTDPCTEKLKLSNCGGEQTACNKLEKESSNFACTCNEGFASYGIFYPVTDRRTVIHKCQDINECLVEGACPNTTTCTNTQGSYECFCQSGYRLLNATDNPKAAGCVEVCSTVFCGRGECELDGSYYSCKCNDGYTGANCDKKVQTKEVQQSSPKGAEIALITLSTIVIPLVLFSLYMIHKYRILSKKANASGYLDDNSSTLSMEPLRRGLSGSSSR